VIEKAREIAGQDRDAWSVARKLSDWTFKNLKWKRVDNADAVDTLATREADCLEFSQLFVAMARALGLPARIVSGMAYSDGSFGGHAWVEVYAGRWIELDPTWGTDFVDATHLRSTSGDLLAYAALNLVSIEVMDAPRRVADYQRDAQLLSAKICEEMNANNRSALTSAIDMAALADRHIGAGTWSKMSEPERERLISSGPKIITYLATALSGVGSNVRVLSVNKTADRAEATLTADDYSGGAFLKFELARKGDVWLLMDVINAETDLHLANERLRPIFRAIVASRDGKQKIRSDYSDLERALILLNSDDDKGALNIIEQLLKEEPDSRRLRNLKALCLSNAEEEEKTKEAVKLWTQLGNEEPPMGAALFALASYYTMSKEEADKKKAVELFARYIALETSDPRPHDALANLYQEAGESERALAEYRTAIERDPHSQNRHLEVTEILVKLHRYDEALAFIDESARAHPTLDNLFGQLFARFYMNEMSEAAEELVSAHPERLAKNAEANFYLAHMRLNDGRASEALPLLKRAIEIKKDYSEVHTALAAAYRQLRNWTAALASANAALGIDSTNAEAHYHMACALAQMNRRTDAIIALKRAIELDDELAYEISEEQDLKPLSRLPEFIKLIPKEEAEKK
jgi:tetratricopeptide (TPR) repeat protein